MGYVAWIEQRKSLLRGVEAELDEASEIVSPVFSITLRFPGRSVADSKRCTDITNGSRASSYACFDPWSVRREGYELQGRVGKGQEDARTSFSAHSSLFLFAPSES